MKIRSIRGNRSVQDSRHSLCSLVHRRSRRTSVLRKQSPLHIRLRRTSAHTRPLVGHSTCIRADSLRRWRIRPRRSRKSILPRRQRAPRPQRCRILVRSASGKATASRAPRETSESAKASGSKDLARPCYHRPHLRPPVAARCTLRCALGGGVRSRFDGRVDSRRLAAHR